MYDLGILFNFHLSDRNKLISLNIKLLYQLRQEITRDLIPYFEVVHFNTTNQNSFFAYRSNYMFCFIKLIFYGFSYWVFSNSVKLFSEDICNVCFFVLGFILYVPCA